MTSLLLPRIGAHPGPRLVADPASVIATALGWITLVLLLDAHGGRWEQRALGVGTWVVLALLLRTMRIAVRLQTAVVVVVATMVEFTFSPVLGVYAYRFHNVPMYVPPGHGLVYLAALSFGELTFVLARLKVARTLVVIAIGAYAVYGLIGPGRTDVLGAFWYLCLVGFLYLGPSVGLYVGAAVVVTYLELLGTSLGTWAWHAHDPTGLVAIGNPPSGAAGGYGWFDLAAIGLAPTLLRLVRRRTAARSPDRPPDAEVP
jgi:hypothetical protein